ncbi:hypothetical protein DYE50_06040 [Treponema ruminis]|nr:hypothetical protein DYE50_06040 [Treponema ruminis]
MATGTETQESFRMQQKGLRDPEQIKVKIEELWKEIMKDYLGYSKRSLWIHAKKGSHYIHLTEPEIIVESVNRIRHM